MTPKKWDEISYHSPLSEENRDRIRHAIRKGHESVWCDLNQRESDWLEYVGFQVSGKKNYPEICALFKTKLS
jgi:hypothetical protein